MPRVLRFVVYDAPIPVIVVVVLLLEALILSTDTEGPRRQGPYDPDRSWESASRR